MISSFLMIGQSNIAGRGYLKDVGQIYDEVKSVIFLALVGMASILQNMARLTKCFSKKNSVLAPLPTENEIIKLIQERPLTKTEKIALLEISFAGGKILLNDFEEQLKVINKE